MTPLVFWIWAATLAVVAVVIAPLAFYLLHRTLRAAIAIERHTREALAAGAGIAANTAAVKALDDTIGAAASLLEPTRLLQQQTEAIADALGRARGRM